MANGPISLPHINVNPQQKAETGHYQNLPSINEQNNENSYFHGQSFNREGIASHFCVLVSTPAPFLHPLSESFSLFASDSFIQGEEALVILHRQ
jgi:hypothetical protein